MDALRMIRTEGDHRAALAEIRSFDDDAYEPGTPATERLDILVTLVRAFEAEAHPIPAGDPVDVLHHAIDSMGRSRSELADLVGSEARASELLDRRRRLTLPMIRAISAAWSIPVAALTAGYELAGASARARRRKGARQRPEKPEAA